MGSSTSHTGSSTVVKDRESSHISIQSSQFAKTKVPRMALAFDSQLHHQDDLGHDTLMGLQELDSIFEETAAPTSLSDGSSDDFHDAPDMTSRNHSHEAERNNFKTKVETVALPRNIVEANGTSKYAYPIIKYLAIEAPPAFNKS